MIAYRGRIFSEYHLVDLSERKVSLERVVFGRTSRRLEIDLEQVDSVALVAKSRSALTRPEVVWEPVASV